MFDIGASELLVIVIVAVLVIGPKDLPLALRTAGRWIGKVRRVSAQFRTGFDAMVREAEMEEMEKKWKEQNARIMAEHPGDVSADGAQVGAQAAMTPLPASDDAPAPSDSAEKPRLASYPEPSPITDETGKDAPSPLPGKPRAE
jgi:sec-independent protein translocase protein TatB